MKHVLVFVVRVVIFQGVFCLKLFVRSHYQLHYEVSTQVLVSSLQICIVFAAVMLYKMSRFVVYTINDGRHYATVEEEDDEETCSTRIERTDGMDDVQDAASTPSKPQIDTIVFAGSRSLREYVLCMHTLGILLWGTFYSFDYSTTVAFYYFVYGLLFGWLVRIWRAGPEINIVLCVVYVGLFATVMGINHPKWVLVCERGLAVLCGGVAGGVWRRLDELRPRLGDSGKRGECACDVRARVLPCHEHERVDTPL